MSWAAERAPCLGPQSPHHHCLAGRLPSPEYRDRRGMWKAGGIDQPQVTVSRRWELVQGGTRRQTFHFRVRLTFDFQFRRLHPITDPFFRLTTSFHYFRLAVATT